MKIRVKTGEEYLLDEKVIVKVIKPLNRSNTTFSVEESKRKNILTVEGNRLSVVNKIRTN